MSGLCVFMSQDDPAANADLLFKAVRGVYTGSGFDGQDGGRAVLHV